MRTNLDLSFIYTAQFILAYNIEKVCKKGSMVNEITDEMFRKQVASTYVESLVDAESEIFYKQLEEKNLLG